jgi:hypothetical protein
MNLPYTQRASTITRLNYLGTEFVHVRLLQGNIPQSEEN